MTNSSPFKGRPFQPEITLGGVRGYLRYSLSSRDVEARILERGLHGDHPTGFRWVPRYAPEVDKRSRPHLKTTNDAYRVDETYLKIKKGGHYLYRAVDSDGHTMAFLLRETRDAKAAQKFCRKVLGAHHTGMPRVITVDQNAAYPLAFEARQQQRLLPETCLLRLCKSLNNVIEQDHRFVKRRVHPGLGVGTSTTAQRTIQGYEAMHMLRKGQLEGMTKGDVLAQNRVINHMFELAA